jgi:DNA invertase Pin-like site-specific DNA recombinase
MKRIQKHCAIYCRKSSDEGLDTDFNTLDAQREACEAYITSQQAEGWKAINTQYSDGGYSGGNLDRPALQRLLDDIKDGKVHTIVVYKIDRLTRSLMDFAKLVDVFDEHGVTFVSVTQSFNTTTSMGRLTLNVLLSFAQFEREVSAERIRDKIAASKKKGMWMGGNPPIGYEAMDRKLIINTEDAKIAQHIFERYLTLGSVTKLKDDLDLNGIKSKKRISKRGKAIGGKPFSRGALYSILRNPIYIGKIKHKDKTYDGQHETIIDDELWHKVQHKLLEKTGAERGHKKSTEKNLLKGLLFDCDGTPYSPDYTKKKNKVYRYYTSQNLIQYRDHPKGIMARIPAPEIEDFVTKALQDLLPALLDLHEIEDHHSIVHIKKHPVQGVDLVRSCVNQITLNQDELTIEADSEKLRSYLEEELNLPLPHRKTSIEIIPLPFTTRRAHRGTIIIEPEGTKRDPLDLPPEQIKNLVRGIVWRDEHFDGMTMKDIAARESLSEAGVRKIIMRSFETLQSL